MHLYLQAQEKETVNEGHIHRLQSTIERMLKESNDRMKTHNAERKTLTDERVRELYHHSIHYVSARVKRLSARARSFDQPYSSHWP